MATLSILIVCSGLISSLVAAQNWNWCSNRCGKECCKDDEECQFNSTCVKGKKTFCSDGLSYCLEPTKCCGVMTCCPSDADCCGLNTCCPSGAVCCGIGTCCPPESTCCGFSTCCAKGSICQSGQCKSKSVYMSAGFSWFYLCAILLPLAAIIAMINYRRRRQQMLREACQRGRLISPAPNDWVNPSATAVSPTNAGYDQPPPAYDVIATSTEADSQQQVAAPPSYYELYKDAAVKADETETAEPAGTTNNQLSGNTSEQTNRSEAQEDSSATSRTGTHNS